MSAANRRKGHRLEVAVARYLGVRTTREEFGSDGFAQAGFGDLVTPGRLIEVRNRDRLAIPSWHREVEADADGMPWAIIAKRKGVGDIARQHVIIDLAEFRNLTGMVPYA